MDVAVGDLVDQLHIVGDVDIAFGIGPQVDAAVAVVVARVVEQVKGDAHAQTHRAFFEEMEFGGRVVFLADEHAVAVVGSARFAGAGEAQAGGHLQSGVGQAEALVGAVATDMDSAALVFGETDCGRADAAFPVGAAIYEYAVALHSDFPFALGLS